MGLCDASRNVRFIWVVAFALMPPEKVRLWSIREKIETSVGIRTADPLVAESWRALYPLDHGDPRAVIFLSFVSMAEIHQAHTIYLIFLRELLRFKSPP